jgi:uncharacterized repeat protein (TIGR01451 family)
LGNNHDTTTNLLSPQVDLEISKRDSGVAVAGTVLTYTVTYTNAGGPSDASEVLITDQLPAGVSYGRLVSAVPPVVESGPSGGAVTWALDALPVDASGTIVFTVNVDASLAEGTISNQVSIAGAESELDNSDNRYALDTVVTTEADLWVQKVGTPDPATAGGLLTYTLSYGNDGPSVAVNAWLTDTLPMSVAIVSVDPPTSTQSSQTLRWELGTLAAGAPGEITIVVGLDAAATGSLTNRAAIGADTNDGDIANNADQTVTAVESRVDLALSKTAPAAVNPGGVLTYTLSYTNAGGPSLAHGVVVTDQLSTDVTFAGMVTGPAPSISGQLLSWSLGSLDVGASGTLAFTVTVGGGVANGTELTNRAGISSSDIELNETDNTAQAVTTVTTGTLASSTAVPLAQEPGPSGMSQQVERASWLYLILGTVSALGYGARWRALAAARAGVREGQLSLQDT